MKYLSLIVAGLIFISGCTSSPIKSGKVMQIVKMRTSLNDKEFLRIAHEREPCFASNPAILQKYYIKLNEPGYYGGVYIWESKEALQKFKESNLPKTIAKAYRGIERPSVEIVDIFFQLRN